MAEKKTYTVLRAMHGDGKDYARGDTRELSDADAAPMIAAGSIALKGHEPAAREPAVRHTFGQEPSQVNESGYTTATGEGIVVGRPAGSPAPKASPKPKA